MCSCLLLSYFRCVAIDNRGYGDSEKPTGIKNYSIDHLTGDVKNLITGKT